MNPFYLVGIGLTLLVTMVNCAIIIAIKFNDLKHSEITLNKIEKKVDKLCDRVSFIEGLLKIEKT